MQTTAGDAQVKTEPNEAPLQPQTQQSEWSIKLKNAEDHPYSESAWNALLDFAEESSDLEKIKEAYEALLQKYPNTVRIIPMSFNSISREPKPMPPCFRPKVDCTDIIFEPFSDKSSHVSIRRRLVRPIFENICVR